MKFNQEQIKQLEQNPNVHHVGLKHVYYSAEFKQKAIQQYLLGKTARQIFSEAGFNLQEISNATDYASKTISKWRSNINNNCSNVNKNNMHYSKKKIKEQRKESKTNYQKLQERLEYLEAENEFLKKLRILNEQFR